MVHDLYMKRCLELARVAIGKVAPNPMVGCVIVYDNKIIGEGWHQQYGMEHAEVNAIRSVKDPSLLNNSTLYVNLEPCSHYGKTPPCSDLIAQKEIPEVIIGCIDTFLEVSGKGIEKLKSAGCNVTTGILNEECRELNKRFFTFHEKKRPFIILKWAQSSDAYIGKLNSEGTGIKISGELSQRMVHQWRSEEAAIMVGTNTALNDNPQLNTRFWPGDNPLRIVIDRTLRLPSSLHLFDRQTPTLVFTEKDITGLSNAQYSVIDFNELAENILQELHQRNIQSVIIEGGANLLNEFISKNLWDEARIFISPKFLNDGIKAPEINLIPISEGNVGEDRLVIFRNKI
jgi:diaminohydroxyphosphoribosylaminopyrimidine deaminase / 5-amino-6-(5-phosphoribosylamino)uracil reductase